MCGSCLCTVSTEKQFMCHIMLCTHRFTIHIKVANPSGWICYLCVSSVHGVLSVCNIFLQHMSKLCSSSGIYIAKGVLQKQHLANTILFGEPTVCILYAIVYSSMWEYHRIVYCGIEQDVAVCSSR